MLSVVVDPLFKLRDCWTLWAATDLESLDVVPCHDRKKPDCFGFFFVAVVKGRTCFG